MQAWGSGYIDRGCGVVDVAPGKVRMEEGSPGLSRIWRAGQGGLPNPHDPVYGRALLFELRDDYPTVMTSDSYRL